MDPRVRLRRRYPGERLAEPRPLGTRVFGRDKPLREPREVVGSVVSLPEVKIRAHRSQARPSPNAPLLKRLVMYPYRQSTSYGRRQAVREPVPWDVLTRQDRETVADILAERPEPAPGSSVREAMQRLVTREIPSVELWLGGRDDV